MQRKLFEFLVEGKVVSLKGNVIVLIFFIFSKVALVGAMAKTFRIAWEFLLVPYILGPLKRSSKRRVVLTQRPRGTQRSLCQCLLNNF